MLSSKPVMLPTVNEDESDIKDRENPYSLVNIAPTFLSNQIMATPNEILNLEEEVIRKKGNITNTDELLRIAFWIEFGMAQKGSRKLNLANIYNGICTKSNFINIVQKDQLKLAFILKVPHDYRLSLEYIVSLGNQQMIAIMSKDHTWTDKDGNVRIDSKHADIKRRIWRDAQEFTRGLPVHRTENRNLNANFEFHGQHQANVEALPANAEELEEKIKDLIKDLDLSGVDNEQEEGS